jgi:hypothetical protein
MTQKVAVRPSTKYELSVTTRAVDPKARLSVSLCPKHILYSDRWNGDCPAYPFQSAPGGAWTKKTIAFDSGPLGKSVPFTWPIIMQLHNESEDATVEITGVHLTDGITDLVSNGDFAAGGDRWLLISDFEHHNWHIKNLYVELFFESGAVGLAIFVFTLLAALVRACKTARDRPPIGVGIAGALVGFAVVGSVGSLLDNPRPALLFFLLLFWALQPIPNRTITPKSTA